MSKLIFNFFVGFNFFREAYKSAFLEKRFYKLHEKS
jgi:hypothetical protein